MPTLTRITHDPAVMGGKPCIRGLRVTVGTIVGLVAAGRSHEEILRLYPYLEAEDIREALTYAAWRVEEREDWQMISKAGLARAYSDDEPDYPANLVRERAARGSREKFERVLSKVPDVEPEPHDHLSPDNAKLAP